MTTKALYLALALTFTACGQSDSHKTNDAQNEQKAPSTTNPEDVDEVERKAHLTPDPEDAVSGPKHFNGIKWGSSPKDVIAAMGKEPSERGGKLVYNDVEIFGIKGTVWYMFENNQLEAARIFSATGTPKDQINRIFLAQRGELRKRFGTPSTYEPNRIVWTWNNDLSVKLTRSTGKRSGPIHKVDEVSLMFDHSKKVFGRN